MDVASPNNVVPVFVTKEMNKIGNLAYVSGPKKNVKN